MTLKFLTAPLFAAGLATSAIAAGDTVEINVPAEGSVTKEDGLAA